MVNKSSTTKTRAPKSSKLKDSEIMRIMLTYIMLDTEEADGLIQGF